MPEKCPHCNEPLPPHIIELGSEGSKTLICPNCMEAVIVTLPLENGSTFHLIWCNIALQKNL